MYREILQKGKILFGTILVISTLFANTAWALPKDGKVVAGNSKFFKPNSTTLYIKQTSDKSIINWKGYSINANQTVQYFQPRSSSISLNRVTGSDPSVILGQLLANGQVWVINPNGLLVGKDAKINVGSFLGSTLRINDQEFLNGRYEFHNSAKGLPNITNQGDINAAEGGYVVLISPSITNKGSITANSGEVYLTSGDKVTLNFAGNDLIGFIIDKATAKKALGIKNTGTIIANGGEVILSAKVASDVLKTVINNEGLIQAQTIENKNGVIKLLGGTYNNAISVGDTLDASAPNGGDGGFIETSAANIKVAKGTIVTTVAPYGTTGTWLIDPATLEVKTGGTGTVSDGQNDPDSTMIDPSTVATALDTTNLILNADNNITVTDGISWTSANTLTLSTNIAGSTIAINAPISGINGGLTLNTNGATDVISTGTASTVNVANFILQSGAWTQNSATLPAFTASNDFEIQGSSTFLRVMGGTGTLGSPYQIADVYGLQGVASLPMDNYVLSNDIDASGMVNWNFGAGFAPIGGFPNKFTGTFDGLGHTINNLYINRPTQECVGLFGFTGSGSSVSNVGLVEGSINGNRYVGGLVGQNENGGTIGNSYFTGSVNGTYFVGGLVGDNAGTLSNSHYDIDNVVINGGNYVTEGGIYRDQYTDWFADKALNITDYFSQVDGYYTLNNPNDLKNLLGFADNPLYSFRLTNDLDLSAVPGLYLPFFAGVAFDGNSKTISNLSVNQPFKNNNIGFIGRLNSGSFLTGLNLTGVSVTGYNNIGGLVGYKSGGAIDNSHVAGNISGSGNNIGGLVGYNYGSIYNSSVTGDVSGGSDSYYVGGLVGSNYGGYISNTFATNSVSGGSNSSYIGGLVGSSADGGIADSYATGNVSGATIIGGLVGASSSYSSGETIEASYATGSVNGNQYVGGLVGLNSSTIIYSSATGNVTGDGGIATGVGGLIGYNSLAGYVSNSDATGSVSGSSGNFISAAGGLVGVNAGTVRDSYATGSLSSGRENVGGLVGYNDGGTVTNSHATGNITGGGNYLGGLIGRNEHSNVSNAYATGSISGGSSYCVGGLVGYNQNSTISNVYATGDVSATGSLSSGNNYAGGLVGYNDTNTFIYSNSITNAYAKGNVSATGDISGNGKFYVGGLVGYNYSSNTRPSSISNSYATGNVTATGNVSGTGSGSYYVGGLVGYNYRSSSGASTINNAYTTGNVSGTGSGSGSYVGGFAGYNSGTITNSYWDTVTSGTSTGIGGGTLTGVAGLTTAQMMDSSNFSGWTFGTAPSTGIWFLIPDNTRPFMQMEYSTNIVNAHQLQLMVLAPTATYTLAADIDMSELANPSGMWGTANATYATGITTGFISIGNSSTPFTGTFDGQNHTISNLTINRPIADYVGLFGYIGSGATVSNVGLVGGSVSGQDFAGMLAGYNYGTVSKTYATGSVSGSYEVGGLVGWNSGTVSKSYATGSTGGTDDVGGLAGGNFGTITDSYATGRVTGASNSFCVGGLLGYNWGTISDSYAAGSVTGYYYVGGLVGSSGSGSATNSFWDTITTGQALSAVGAASNTTNMKTLALTSGLYSSWNTGIWNIADGSYPTLK